MKLLLKANNSKSILLTALMGVGVLGYLIFVFLPAQQSIGQLREQLAEKRQYVLDVDTEYAHLATRRQEIDQIRAYVDEHNASMVPDMSSLLTQITESARRTGVKVQKISPRENAGHQTLREHEMGLTLEGEFAAIFQFLGQLEQWPGHLWFDRVHFDAERQDGQTLVCKLNLTIFTDRHDSSD